MARFRICLITLLFLFAQNIHVQGTVFDITKYGAKPDGKTNMTQAFLKAWKDACASPTPSTLLIPKGEFLMNSVTVQGECKAYLHFKVVGTLKAPAKVADMHGADGFITMNYVNGITISGGGVFDGQGAQAWARNDCGKNAKCGPFPVNIRFNSVVNALVTDVTSKDSKNFHVNVIGAKNFTFDRFHISTPDTSINTDGIHIGRSEDVKVIDSDIKSGDDCISVGDGMKQLLVERVTCGPGHGFSIGSLGRNLNEADIVGVTFRNSTLTGTTNGLRIKTWPSSPQNYKMTVSNIHFEDLIMNNVENPVIIDQEYCPYNSCNKKNPSLVKITGVTIKNIRGTFTSQDAVKFLCSPRFPCDKVEVGNINLKYVGKNNTITSLCSNVKPIRTGKQVPAICITGQSLIRQRAM